MPALDSRAVADRVRVAFDACAVLRRDLAGLVGAAVVDDDDLVLLVRGARVQHDAQSLEHGGQARRLVLGGDDEGDLGHGKPWAAAHRGGPEAAPPSVSTGPPGMCVSRRGFSGGSEQSSDPRRVRRRVVADAADVLSAADGHPTSRSARSPTELFPSNVPPTPAEAGSKGRAPPVTRPDRRGCVPARAPTRKARAVARAGLRVSTASAVEPELMSRRRQPSNSRTS